MKVVSLKNRLVLIISIASIFSCTTSKPESPPDFILPEFIEANQELSTQAADPAPLTVTDPPPVPSPVVAGGEEPFDPSSISRAEFIATKAEMQRLVEEINWVIRIEDYDAWVSYLSDDFIKIINSPGFLETISQSSRLLRSKNIQLKSARDYFTYVVVASRENIKIDARLDDIEFLSYDQVKAFTLFRNQRVRLFDFVRAGDSWKLASPT